MGESYGVPLRFSLQSIEAMLTATGRLSARRAIPGAGSPLSERSFALLSTCSNFWRHGSIHHGPGDDDLFFSNWKSISFWNQDIHGCHGSILWKSVILGIHRLLFFSVFGTPSYANPLPQWFRCWNTSSLGTVYSCAGLIARSLSWGVTPAWFLVTRDQQSQCRRLDSYRSYRSYRTCPIYINMYGWCLREEKWTYSIIFHTWSMCASCPKGQKNPILRQERLGHVVPVYDTLDGKTLVPYQCVMVRALTSWPWWMQQEWDHGALGVDNSYQITIGYTSNIQHYTISLYTSSF